MITKALLALCLLCGAGFADPQPEVFGPGVLSAGEVYRGTFTPDGRGFYFFKKVTPGQEDYRIFRSNLTDGKWGAPQRVDLGGDYSDLYPAISRDGKRMVFSSYRPAPGAPSAGKPNAHLWFVERTGDDWGKPVFMNAASLIGHYHSGPQFGPDGAIYFNRTTPDWKTSTSLVTRWNGKEYAAAQVYEDAERWKQWRADLFVWGGAPGYDGTFMNLDVSRKDPQTGRALSSDIWVSFRSKEGWGEPRPMGAGINSSGYDNFVFYSPDGRDLFFVRDFKAFYRVPLAAALASARS